MGKYYSRQGRNLYIYLTEGDSVIDLDLFPEGLNLFNGNSAWRIKDKMAIVNDVDEADLDRAEIILSLNSYGRWDQPEELLELYYTLGDESILGETPTETTETIAETRVKAQEKPSKLGVVIPEAIEPLVGPQESMGEKFEKEVIIPPSLRQRSEAPARPQIERPMSAGEPSGKTPRKEIVKKPRPSNEEELIEHVIGYIRGRGFYYPDNLVKNYYACLKTKPFVILSGFSGLGKTALTRLFAEAVSDDIEEQYLRVPVPPNVMDEKYLTGYYNPLTDKYISTPFLDFALKAVENPDKLYFVCLDEMSLSRVENYFAQLLSAMESVDSQVYLHGTKRSIETDDGRLVPGNFKMPNNLMITGTIDIDRASYPLSPNLIDRTNTIEFHDVDLLRQEKMHKHDLELGLDVEILKRFRRSLNRDEEDRVVNSLAEINGKTIKYNIPVTYRMRQEILEYVANARGLYDDDRRENLGIALDLQVKQRVLTRIAGTSQIRPLLNELLEYFRGGMPVSEEKARRMLGSLDLNGFASFYF
jgi:hypothetical protein